MIRDLFRLLGDDGRAFRSLLIALVASSFVQGTAFVVLVPVFRVLLGPDPSAAWSWIALEGALLAAYAALTYWSKWATLDTSTAVALSLWQRVGDHIATLPLGWFDTRRSGDVSKVVGGGVFEIMGAPANLLRPLIETVVTPATVIVGMLFVDWRIALITAVVAPLLYIAYRWTGSLLLRTDQRSHDAAVEVANRVVEFAQNQPVLRAFGGGDARTRSLDAALQEQRDSDRKRVGSVVVAQFGFGVIVQAAFTLLVLASVFVAVGGTLASVDLVMLLILATRFVQPLLDAGDLGGAVRIIRRNIWRLEAILDTPALKEGSVVAGVDASVEFESVTFGYNEDQPVLRNVSFRAPANSLTALVGPSGAGKTTITRLVARFWDVTGGQVLIGGQDVRTLTAAGLMRQLSFVFQDVYLFRGSIRENILLAKPEASSEELDRVVRLARVDEIVDRLPEGLDTQTGEGGTSLSGGERQRVSIARALLKDAPIVLLDEATAALDPENEALVQEALSALAASRTVIVIAHRLQTIMAADQILVLDDGVIAEAGRHEELLGSGGRYSRFWAERERSQGWRIGAQR
ncbi:ABC transporter ATP-binding protein [Rhodococcus ruber]|uniref:ABC transporter ATP-binding protein n=1 Tax=Rhodococcus ruber TaxID=1830 RepID=A0ABT4MEU5_9NOCA|nr:ABC transporter ATP-binding protein [Rhodococcus ruber]MCZ4519492.1 ABC transporter ATP-binding protein [Rhodococcus ruber]